MNIPNGTSNTIATKNKKKRESGNTKDKAFITTSCPGSFPFPSIPG